MMESDTETIWHFRFSVCFLVFLLCHSLAFYIIPYMYHLGCDTLSLTLFPCLRIETACESTAYFSLLVQIFLGWVFTPVYLATPGCKNLLPWQRLCWHRFLNRSSELPCFFSYFQYLIQCYQYLRDDRQKQQLQYQFEIVIGGGLWLRRIR